MAEWRIKPDYNDNLLRTVVVTSATGEPVTVAEMQRHMRLSTGSTVESAEIGAFITVARQLVEEWTNHKLMPQTIYAYYQDWPASDDQYLPHPPLRSIASSGIYYTGSSGNSTTLSSTKWTVDAVSEPGRVTLEHDDDWPTETLHPSNPVRYEMACGYSTKATVPESFKLAIKLAASHYYENRENVIASNVIPREIPMGVSAILRNYTNYSGMF